MAINIGIGRTFPGYGVGLINDASYHNYGVALAGTAAQTVTVLPPTGTFSIGFTCCKVRVKVYNGAGTSPTLVSMTLEVSDGTNTVTVYAFRPNVAVTLSSTSWYDSGPIELVVDTASSGSGGGSTGQLIAPTNSAAGGITSITAVTTLGGTSPAATADIEVVPLIP